MKQSTALTWGFILLSFALTGLVFVLEQNAYFFALNAQLEDKLLEPRPASKDIVIVAIDDASIKEFGVWPWPRTLHGEMIDVLTKAGARVIGYDVTFSEVSGNEEADNALEDALWRSPKVVLVSEHGATPLERFSLAARDVGQTILLPDPDGVVRRVHTNDSFAGALAEKQNAVPVVYRVPFVGEPGSFTTYSFADVLSNKVKTDAFKNKIVLVGATAPDLHDAYLVPTAGGTFMSGVEIQANVIQGIIEGKTLRTINPTEKAVLFIALAWLTIILGAVFRLRYFLPATAVITALFLILALGLASSSILTPIVYPLLIIGSITILNIIIRYFQEKQRRTFIHNAFAHYLAPQVIEKLVRGETKLELGGTKQELTILFSDIRGFTSISEKLSPEELVKLLNEYLTAMTDVILTSEGVVDKYIGDAIMAFWGAPLPQVDHALRAARVAVQMKRTLSTLQEKWKAEGRPEINIGIGLNTGEVVVGNMGSKQRFDYTVMGDDVNLASRLESLTKQYGVTILATEAVIRKLGTEITSRPIDLVAVKGKSQPVKIFELSPPEYGQEFAYAFDLYYARKWSEALPVFERLAKQHNDKPSVIFSERCREHLATLPPLDWTGVYVAKEK